MLMRHLQPCAMHAAVATVTAAECRYVWLPLWVLAVPPAVQKVVQQREAQGSRSNRPAGAKPVLPASSIDVVVRWHATWKLDVLQDVPASRYLEQVGL